PVFFSRFRPTPRSTLFPYTTLFRSGVGLLRRFVRGAAKLVRRRGRPARRAFGAAFQPGAWLAAHVDVSIPERREIRLPQHGEQVDRKSTRLNSSHQIISYAVFCLKK